ncbi:M24 family metallopeptidase, partial [Candidatus Omnitrophota bacterium]
MIEIKTEREIALMEDAGRVVKTALQRLKKSAIPGISTEELDRLAGEIIKDLGAKPAFKGYKGFPGNICTSINEQVVHGIPGKKK